jgi:hypothetical protein
MKRLTVLAVTAVLVALVAADAGGAAPAHGSLVVTTHFDPSRGIPTEGFYEYLRIARDGFPAQVLRLERKRTAIDLPAGHYRLVRYVRTCDGNCSFLDAASVRCRAGVRVTSRKRTRAAIASDAQSCRITVSR